MPNSFWELCTDALEAFRLKDITKALNILESAKTALASSGLSGDLLEKRKQHVAMLLSHFQQGAIQQEESPSVSKEEPVINVLIVIPEPIDSPYGYSALNMAKGLSIQKVSCAIAVPNADVSFVNSSAFPIKTYSEIKNGGFVYPNGKSFEVIHAWTAQELVREFCIDMQKKYSSKLVIHILNNEEYLTEKILGKAWQQLKSIPAANLPAEQVKQVFHPQYGPDWINEADGVTYTIDTLKRFNFSGVPSIKLLTTVEENLFFPRPLNWSLREKLNIPKDHAVIVYPGNVRAANQEEVSQLYKAVEILNQQGIATTLIRTGKNRNPRVLSLWPNAHVKDLGWVKRDALPDIMAAADIFVQPGAPGPYSDQRVPNKLLEYFAIGRSVILPRSNLGLNAIHCQEAYILDKADADGIAKAVIQIKTDQELSNNLRGGAVDFYLKCGSHEQYQNLTQLYRTVLGSDRKITVKPLLPIMEQSKSQPINTPFGASITADNGELKKLQLKIAKLELEKTDLSTRLRSMPSIDPLCISDPTFSRPAQVKDDFGIIVFGHTRLDALGAVLESLKRQDALKFTEVWLDGYQGNHNLKLKIEKTIELVKKYPIKHLHKQAGNFGFRKMLILGLIEMCNKYRDILILEDDCFPTHDAISEFRRELDLIRENNNIFSVYGHHFLVESERETCARFQGWGWATTSEKLMPMLRQLIDCYSMTEKRYLEFVNLNFTPDIKSRIDVTHPRQPSYTLTNFFAWDETLCLLTALNNQVHRPTPKRTIYNCGMGKDSTHFHENEMFRSPPFNLISPDEVWQYY